MRRAALLAALTVAAVAAPSAHAAFPGSNGRIAYVRPGYGLYSVERDGTSRLRLSANGCDSAPAFSPSGLALAFQTCDPARHATVVGTMSSAGLGRRIVVHDSDALPSPQTPGFSPSGDRLVFAAGASPSTRLFVAGTDASHRRRVKAIGYSPSWSATGHIAFTVPLNRRRWCNSTELDDVYSLKSVHGGRHRVTRTYGSYAPDWSPDGRRIAYTRDFTLSSRDARQAGHTPMDCKPVVSKANRYGPEIVVARASGSHAHRLTSRGGSDPAWSPNGRLIAFERSGWIWVMRADGSHERRLTRGYDPTWQPIP